MGDREATLRKALADIDALPDVRLSKQSKFHRYRPVGGPANQGEFLNAAAVFDTSVPPLQLMNDLQQIEARHGRERGERWAQRPLDIDILLYGNEVAETEMLSLPHPRMSYRRFVLEPSAEVAPRMLHPTIGWPIEQLLLHLTAASDLLAVMSPSETARDQVMSAVAKRYGVSIVKQPAVAEVAQAWPAAVTTWIELPVSQGNEVVGAQEAGLPYAAADFPKISILLDAATPADGVLKAQWSSVVRRPGRGPTLRLQTSDVAAIEAEVFAAVDSVWPDLGPASANRLK
jgi:2-amino-4-hydroxy-6-hydroxymethyldihydropteridine diphosphokinase